MSPLVWETSCPRFVKMSYVETGKVLYYKNRVLLTQVTRYIPKAWPTHHSPPPVERRYQGAADGDRSGTGSFRMVLPKLFT
jgi:hypothetical protein